MKRDRKFRKILWLCVLLGIFAAGCGKASQTTAPTQQGTETAYSRAEWVQDLGNKFGYLTYENETPIFSDVSAQQSYFTQVQACAEWGVITEQGAFAPDEATTWDYALSSAVRAIGTERLRQAGYEPDENALSDFFLSNIAGVDIADLGEKITKDEAVQVLSFASDFENGLQYEQINEVSYQDGVQEVSEKDILLRGDGESAYIVGDKTFAEGNVLLYTNNETREQMAVKVSSVEDNLVWYTEATIEDIYKSFRFCGSYKPEIVDVISAQSDTWVIPVNETLFRSSEQGRLENLLEKNRLGQNYFATETKVDISAGDGTISFKISGENWAFEAGIRNITTNADAIYDELPFGAKKYEKIMMSVGYDDYVHGELGGSVGTTIPLGRAKLEIPNLPGLEIELKLVLNLGADGKATVDYTAHVVAQADWESGKGIRTKVENQNATLDFHAEVTVTAEPVAKASLKLWSIELINAKVTSGIVGIAKVDVDILGNQPACTDLHLYVPLRWAVNEDSCLLTLLFGDKVKCSGVIWDANHSDFEWKMHYENGEQVEACTRGQGEEIKAETVDENNVPFDEYKKFDFEEIDFATIKLECYNMFLEKDETLKIGFREIPNGQSKDSLIYEVVDTQGVCRPNGDGTVTGLKPGAANIKISTADGKYNAYITVVVQDDYSLSTEFDPL